MKVLNDYVLLDYQEKEQKKGIILSDVSRSKQFTAKVVAVGELVKTIKKGDKVMFDAFSMRGEVTIEDKKYFILRENFIYLIL